MNNSQKNLKMNSLKWPKANPKSDSEHDISTLPEGLCLNFICRHELSQGFIQNEFFNLFYHRHQY